MELWVDNGEITGISHYLGILQALFNFQDSIQCFLFNPTVFASRRQPSVSRAASDLFCITFCRPAASSFAVIVLEMMVPCDWKDQLASSVHDFIPCQLPVHPIRVHLFPPSTNRAISNHQTSQATGHSSGSVSSTRLPTRLPNRGHTPASATAPRRSLQFSYGVLRLWPCY